jgi:hypothetical protein
MAVATAMNSLPNELLIQITSHLDNEAPSLARFAHEPSMLLTESDLTPLKSLSQVSWRYRKITLPLLFQYVRLALDQEHQWVLVDARLVDDMQTQLTALSDHEFLVYHKMRSKVKSSSTFAHDEAFDYLLTHLWRIQEGDKFLKTTPKTHWLPHLPQMFETFSRFIEQHDLKHHVKSVVVITDKEYELRHFGTAEAPLARAVATIWAQIFSILEPARLVVAAPPTTLAVLLDTHVISSDTWAFNMDMHYIELRQPTPSRLDHMRSNCERSWSSALIHYRPWHHLGYNEGSSISAYSTYEYFLKQSPKILYLILVRLAKEVQPCCNITCFSFTGVFPFVTNVTAIFRALLQIPTLRKVAVQLAPGPENNLLSEPNRMGRAQSGDIWLEWHESYKVIASHLDVFDFEDGAEFESRDCASKNLAQEVGEYMDILRERGHGWRISDGKKGVWIRDHGSDQSATFVTAAGIL